MVQAEKEETDLIKEEELAQLLKIFKGQEMAHRLLLTKGINFEIILQCPVLTKNFTPYLINGLLMA